MKSFLEFINETLKQKFVSESKISSTEEMIDFLNSYKNRVQSSDTGIITIDGNDFYYNDDGEPDNYQDGVALYTTYTSDKFPVKIKVVFPWTDTMAELQEIVKVEKEGSPKYEEAMEEIEKLTDSESVYDFDNGIIEYVDECNEPYSKK